MKIEIESLDDLRALVNVMDPDVLRWAQPALGPSIRAAAIARDLRSGSATPQTQAEVVLLRDPVKDARGAELLRKHIEAEQALRDSEPDKLPPEPDVNDDLPGIDADGVPHNTDWHSEPAKINADGRWRARRKRDEDAYKAWLAKQVVDGALAVAADAGPVATETHALPQDKCWDEGCVHNEVPHQCVVPQESGSEPSAAPAAPGTTVDLAALVAASQEAALDASDSHMDLIKACQAFISDHGHPAYNALKAVVAPLEGAENGKAVPQFTPGERRLMRACIERYPKV